MLLRLTVIEGPRKGEEFVIKDEIVIGRSKGDLQLKDSRASSLHAKITLNSAGQMEIEDLDSSNGTFVNGVKIKKAFVKDGDEILIGKTKIKVEPYNPEAQASELEKGSWQERVEQALNAAIVKSEKPNVKTQSACKTFNPPIRFEIKKGIQAGTNFLYTFGPRKLGAACNDGLLLEPGCPLVAFELLPTPTGQCEFKCDSGAVAVNGQQTNFGMLEDGDEIMIGQTVIVVKALKNV